MQCNNNNSFLAVLILPSLLCTLHVFNDSFQVIFIFIVICLLTLFTTRLLTFLLLVILKSILYSLFLFFFLVVSFESLLPSFLCSLKHLLFLLLFINVLILCRVSIFVFCSNHPLERGKNVLIYIWRINDFTQIF